MYNIGGLNMRDSYIFQKDIYKRYIDSFNDYALSILYGGNVLIGADIEDEYKDIPVDDKA